MVSDRGDTRTVTGASVYFCTHSWVQVGGLHLLNSEVGLMCRSLLLVYERGGANFSQL